MKKKQSLVLLALCYGTAIAWVLISGLYAFAMDAIARSEGAVQTRELTFSDFALFSIQPVPDSPQRTLTTSEDPQLHLAALGTRVSALSFHIAFSRHPGEVALYYAKGGEDFAAEKKIWGVPQDDGSYFFALPGTQIDRLRLDPTNQSGLTMELLSCTLNPPRTLGSFFGLSYALLFQLLVWPALGAALLSLSFELAGQGASNLLKDKRQQGCEQQEA